MNTCQKCGVCCKEGVVVDLKEAIKLLCKYPKAIFHELQVDSDVPSGYSVASGYNSTVCQFLKRNRCSIYKDRTFFCKQYPYGNLHSPRLLRKCKAYKLLRGQNAV